MAAAWLFSDISGPGIRNLLPTAMGSKGRYGGVYGSGEFELEDGLQKSAIGDRGESGKAVG